MSSNNETNNSQNNSNNESDNVPPQSEFNNGSDIPTEENYRNNEANNGGKENKWKEYGWKWIEPLNLVTIALAVVTYLLFRQATNDSQTAEKSSQAAQEAVKEQRYNDSIFRRTDSIKFRNDTTYALKKFKEDSVISGKNFEVSKSVLQAQINSLRQSQNDFETENRPFLVYTDVIMDTPFVNHKIKLHYKIKNAGKFPAKIYGSYSAMGWGIDTSRLLNVKKWVSRPTNDFLPNGDIISESHIQWTFTDYDIRVFKEGIIQIFLFLKINYYSGVLSKEYSTYNVIQISSNKEGLDYSTITNK